ncbi:TIR-like domain protein TSDC protein [Medicago truncatula]|uniref:TIR-like domain protein TSDC protein n=2 Tax=Medicago truncatula TaxID=3880 RepID=G7K8F4_MEDTR|nr:TIR-like domain protein TSDC protein [Medicago truncatula]
MQYSYQLRKKRYAIAQYSALVVIDGLRTVLHEVSVKQHLSKLVGKLYRQLEEKKNDLISNRDRVSAKYKAIDHRIDKVSDDVIKWLKEADILIQEVEKLIQEVEKLIQEVKNLKIQSGVPSWNEYRELQKKIIRLNEKCEFDPFSTRIPSLEHFSNGNIMCFKSREETSDQLLEAFKDDDCSMIGLYGKQGSGKTALVKAMGEKVKYLNIFHEILFVSVTKNPNITAMQDEIADSLNIRFDEAERARLISSTIENMDRPILVIFDDVREKFNPEDVGIPLKSNRCKVLLITFFQQDCDLMYCQRKIQLNPLSTEETWTLFKKKSGSIHDEYLCSIDLLNLAREVASKCEGLPRKVEDVGHRLRGEPIEKWKVLLDSLKHSLTKYQIFLSFRGIDTRDTFTGSLYHALDQMEFTTFFDGDGLHTGDQISPTLLNSIEAARLSIVVLSENYASSTWCLDELVKILECRKSNNQLVWPIFFKVEPSEIRYMRECYGKDMARHERRFGIDSERVQKWRSALIEVSNISGKTYRSGYEYKLIQEIVEDAKTHVQNKTCTYGLQRLQRY